MNLTVTLTDQEAKRILDLAWAGHRAGGPDAMKSGIVGQRTNFDAKEDKRLLESFRGECESAKGMKL